MALPSRKRFPIAFEVSSAQGAAPRASSQRPKGNGQPDDAVSRVAFRCGWRVTRDDTRWVVDPGDGHRVLVESSSAGARERLLRFRRPLQDVTLSPAHEAELLRRNARTAHAGFSIGADGRAALAASLVESSASDSEIEAVIRSMIAGGEPVGTKAIADFDPTAYRTAADSGTWEALILRESLGRSAIAFQFAGTRAVASLSLEGGRHKSVHLLFDRADAWGDQLVQVISICAPAPPEWHHKALLANASLALGAFALATFGPLENLVAVRTLLARTVEPGALLDVVTSLAHIAERAEGYLVGARDSGE
ncbi:MAG: hypothetical protein WC538_04395 [Thermoanaerobaculia bacterium]|jgi:hypothetical protein